MKIFKRLNDDIKITGTKYTAALLAVFIIGSIIIILQGEDPLNAFTLILKGAFGSIINFGSTLRYTLPCILIATAAAIAFKSGVFNLGLEGQLYFGALIAAVVGYSIELPPIFHVTACLLAAGLAGMLYAMIPALLKLFFNVSELITTLMLNFIAVLLTEYITMWWIYDGISSLGSNAIATPTVYSSARLPIIIKGTSASYGILIALAIAVLVYLFYKHTIKGYELKQVGENLKFAKVGGINTVKNFIAIFLISGFISGLCGGIEVMGSYGRFTANFASNMGWDGIMVAYIANNNPIAIVIVSFIWGAIRSGALHMERVTTLNKLTVNILQMLFVLFVSIDYEMLIGKLRKFKKKKTQEEI